MEQTTSERTAGALRAELARRKMTGSHLAAALGWSRTTAWRRLNGSVPLSLDELTAVADHLGIPVADLLAGERAA